MTLTPFHSDLIWKSYNALRPRSLKPYKEGLLEAIKGCVNQGINEPRILVLGAGLGTYDVDLILEVLDQSDRQLPSPCPITVVDWNYHHFDKDGIKLCQQDIEEFLAKAGDKTFDIVVAFLIVQHLVNWRLAMANIARVASGGFLVFDEYESTKAGWFNWIDGTTGFVGLDSQMPEEDPQGKWAAFFRDYYSHLDKKHGVFWEPEVRGTDYKRLHRALKYSGFDPISSHRDAISCNLKHLSEHFKACATDGLGDPACLFSHFAWGSEKGTRSSHLNQFIQAISPGKKYAFIKELLNTNTEITSTFSSESTQELSFSTLVSVYKIPKKENSSEVAAQLAETYWFDGFHDALFHRLLLLHIEELSADSLHSADYEKLQRKKLVQYLIVSGGFTHSLVFAGPVLMTIKKIVGWETETSPDNIAIVNGASEKKWLLDGHLKRMESFARKIHHGSLTESLLSLCLPISVVFRLKDASKEEANKSIVSIALHDMHTGKLAEVAIPRSLVGEVGPPVNNEYEWMPSGPEWRFSRFRAGILAMPSDQGSYEPVNRDMLFAWGGAGNICPDIARTKIEDWVRTILPFLAPLLQANVRVVIVGLYHVRIDDKKYGGLGSLFLVEDIAGKLTDFDVERFRFMQAVAQKFSSIYMIESLRKVVLSEEVLSKQMGKYERIKEPLKALRKLREQIENVSSAISSIEAVMNPFYLYVADPQVKSLMKDLSPLFIKDGEINWHDICNWDADRYGKLHTAVWNMHKDLIKNELNKFGENVYKNYFSILDAIPEDCTEVTRECKKAGYLAKALNSAHSPLCWVLTSLSNAGEDAGCDSKEVVLDNEVPPLAFNLALIALGGEKTIIINSSLTLNISITDDGTGELRNLCDLVNKKLTQDTPSLSVEQQSTALALIIKASKEYVAIRDAGCKPADNKFEVTLTYSLKDIQ